MTLDETRLDSLANAGVRVNIYIDGPEAIHNRQRPTGAGRGSHREALQAHHRLRARGKNTAVLAVLTDPYDVVPALEFFLENGFREARMNPLRPEGRAAHLRNWDDAAFMRDMAREYFRAAQLIAVHNQRSPQAPFVEDNLANLMKSLTDDGCDPEGFHWTFVVDDRGDLWAHPGSYGVEALRLTRHEVPSGDTLRQALALDTAANHSGAGLLPGLRDMRSRLFAACAECRSPEFCIPYYGPKENAEMTSPTCIWRTELASHLLGWLRDAPETARRIARPDRSIANDKYA